MKKVSQKQKPITFRMRAFLKHSQQSSFLEQCTNLTQLQHYLRKSAITQRFNNDKAVDEFKESFVHNYKKQNPINWEKLVAHFEKEQNNKLNNTKNTIINTPTNLKIKTFKEQPIYKQLSKLLDVLTDKEKEQYWLDYYKIYKKVVYYTTDLNYLYIKFKNNNPNLNHCHSDIYQSFCQQFAITFSNYENGFTKLPKKAKNTITIGFKGTSFGLFKHEMPKKYQQEFDEKQNKTNPVTTSSNYIKTNTVNHFQEKNISSNVSNNPTQISKSKKPKKLIYLNGLGLVEYIYHKEDFDLNKVSTVKLTMSKTGKFYLDFCYDLIQDPKIKEQYNKITNKAYDVDMNKDFVGYDWSMSQDNWLIGSKGFNVSFDNECSMHSKKVIKTQKQLDNYKDQYRLFIIELFKINSINNNKQCNNTNKINYNYVIELIKYEYPKRNKAPNAISNSNNSLSNKANMNKGNHIIENMYDYDDLPMIEKIVKIESVKQLEKELKTIQKYQELDKLFNQLINHIKTKSNTNNSNEETIKIKVKNIHKKHDELVGRIKAKEKTLSQVWETIGFKRKDLVCKTAIDILNRDEKYISFEDLSLDNMMNSFNSNGGNNYQFKPLRKRLGNSIYRDLIERTILRAYRVGKVVMTINPKYTSMDCNNCSKRNLFLKLSDKMYKCSGCNYVEHRDVNASKNIEYKGVKEVLYTMGLSSFNNSKLYNKKYKEVLEQLEKQDNEKIVLNTDGQISMVVI